MEDDDYKTRHFTYYSRIVMIIVTGIELILFIVFINHSMNSKTQQKYIRTLKGPKTKEQIIQELPPMNNSYPITTLPYEHIFHDITEFIHKDNSIIDSKEKI